MQRTTVNVAAGVDVFEDENDLGRVEMYLSFRQSSVGLFPNGGE